MARSVFKSKEGRRAIVTCYEKVLAQAASRCPHRRHIVPTALGKTHVIEAGDATQPPLVLLHGTASNSATWLADVPAWSRHFRVIAVDILGEPGLSDDRRIILASDETSTWISSLLDTMDVTRACMVGMSLGGWMGLHFAIRFPERVEALSLIAASGLAPQRRSFIFKALPLALLGDWGMRRVNKIVCGNLELPPEAEEFMLLVGRHFRPMLEPVPVFSDGELQRLGMPVQFFAGSDDVLLHSAAAVRRLVQLLPHAQAHLLEDCGHAILDKGDEILGFLRKQIPFGQV